MHAVLVLIDRLPSHWLGCYGRPQAGTRAFDRLASESVVFDQHLATQGSLTLPAGHFRELKHAFLPHGIRWNEISLDSHAVARELETSLHPIRQMGVDRDAPSILTLRIGEPDRPVDESDLAERIRVPALDFLMERLLAEVTSSPVQNEILLVVASLRGLVAPERTEPQEPFRQFLSETVQTPLLVRLPTHTWGSRRQSLVTTDDIVPTLWEWFEQTAPAAFPARSLLPLIRDEAHTLRESVAIPSTGKAAALRTTRWYLVAPISDSASCDTPDVMVDAARLFLKPDDAWDILDVADQNRTLVEELSGTLADALRPTHQE